MHVSVCKAYANLFLRTRSPFTQVAHFQEMLTRNRANPSLAAQVWVYLPLVVLS
jgi:hypothetical protein